MHSYDLTNVHSTCPMDGLTTVLPIHASVNPGEINHIKLAIADTSDYAYDSVVFIKAKSMSAAPPEPGYLEFKQAIYEVDENVSGGTGEIEIVRTGGSDGSLSAKLQTVYKDGTENTATSFGDYGDYDEVTMILEFEDGESSKTVMIPINDDHLMEGDEIVGLLLTDISNEIIFDTADLDYLSTSGILSFSWDELMEGTREKDLLLET